MQNEETMISPSGVKMKKEVTQKEILGHNGNPMTVYNIKWKPYETEREGRLSNYNPHKATNLQTYYPETSPIQRPGEPIIRRVTLSRQNSPEREHKNFEVIQNYNTEEPEKAHDDYNPPNLDHYKIYQSKEEMERAQEPNPYTKEELQELDQSCPIEDPRNPYHEEYLRLKALYDGKLIQGKEYKKNSPPQPKIVVKKIDSKKQIKTVNHFQEPNFEENEDKENHNTNENDGWMRVKDPLIVEKYFTDSQPEGRQTSQTVKKEYPKSSNKSINRPPTIVIETPLSNSDTPTKVNHYQGPTKLLNEYHYCQECDVAFQPVPYDNFHEHHNTNQQPRGLNRMSSKGSQNVLGPYTPPVYTPDRNFYQEVDHFSRENRESDNDGEYGFCAGGSRSRAIRPQLVKSKNRPYFMGC